MCLKHVLSNVEGSPVRKNRTPGYFDKLSTGLCGERAGNRPLYRDRRPPHKIGVKKDSGKCQSIRL